VLSGEALAIVEGEAIAAVGSRALPAGTKHVIVGAGDGRCVVFTVGARWNRTYRKPDGTTEGRDNWGAYMVDEAVPRHRAGVEEDTTDADVAYASWPDDELTRHREGCLPG
jgi:hypothetical protein